MAACSSVHNIILCSCQCTAVYNNRWATLIIQHGTKNFAVVDQDLWDTPPFWHRSGLKHCTVHSPRYKRIGPSILFQLMKTPVVIFSHLDMSFHYGVRESVVKESAQLLLTIIQINAQVTLSTTRCTGWSSSLATDKHQQLFSQEEATVSVELFLLHFHLPRAGLNCSQATKERAHLH